MMKLIIAHIIAFVACSAPVQLDPAILLGVLTPSTTVAPDGVDGPSLPTTVMPDAKVVTTTTTKAPVEVVQGKDNKPVIAPVPMTMPVQTTVAPSVPVVTVPPPPPPAVVPGVTAKPAVVPNSVPSVTVGPVPAPAVVVTSTKKPIVMAMAPVASDANSAEVSVQKPAPVPTAIV